MDENEQIAAAKANATPFSAVTARQVRGGFVVTGNTQWVNNATRAVTFTENMEGIATTSEQAMEYGRNYLDRRTFDPAQQNMFAA